MAIKIPGSKRVPFYQRQSTIEIAAILPTLFASAAGAFLSFSSQDPRQYPTGWVLIAGLSLSLLAGILKIVQARQKDKDQEQSQSYDGIRSALHVLHNLIAEIQKFTEADRSNGRLRITMHRVVQVKDEESPKEIEQLVDYIGGKGGGPGRKFSCTVGITGKAIREQTPLTYKRINGDYQAFVKEAVRQWSYHERDARKLAIDRHSWMAVPILGRNDNVIAVVYLDSSDRDLFSASVKKRVISSCIGITNYINERYVK